MKNCVMEVAVTMCNSKPCLSKERYFGKLVLKKKLN